MYICCTKGNGLVANEALELKLLVYEALSSLCMRPLATSV